MSGALTVELRKLRRSLVGVVTTLGVLAGTAALLIGVSVAVSMGNPEITAKVGAAGTADWAGLMALGGQITSAGWFLACGVMLSWLFGREFAEGTITALYALPTSRTRIAGAKLLSYTLWATTTSLALTVVIFMTGVCLGYGLPDAKVGEALVRQTMLAVMVAAVATPVAPLATLFRSVLGGVGTTLGLLVFAQVGALLGAGKWIPVVAPAMWALNQDQPMFGPALLLPIGCGLAFAGVALAQWRTLKLRR